MSSTFGDRFESQKLHELFSGKLFSIPDYQRAFSWDTRQVNELLEDISLIVGDQVHYTGTIILHRQSERVFYSDSGVQLVTYDVVDGQQRLTTLVILLDRIRRILLNLNPHNIALTDAIYSRFCFVSGRTLQQQYSSLHPLLTLNAHNHTYFAKAILSDSTEAGLSSQKSFERLDRAVSVVDSYLNKLANNSIKAHEAIENYYRKISNNLIFSVYTVASASEVGVIFEVMNNRGKPLTEMEKVKNYLLYLCSKFEDNEVKEITSLKINRTWEQILTTLTHFGVDDSSHENQLLRSHWLMSVSPLPKKWEQVKSIKDKFSLELLRADKEQVYMELDLYLDSLQNAAGAYGEIFNPTHQNAFTKYFPNVRDNQIEELKDWAHRLRHLDTMAPFVPLLMASRLKSLPIDELTAIYRLCEMYAFRVYRLLQRRSNAGETIFFRLGHELYSGKRIVTSIFGELKYVIIRYSPITTISEALSYSSKYRNWYKWRGIKHFLYEYERHVAHRQFGKKAEAFLRFVQDINADTIEHIMPQSPVAKSDVTDKFKENFETHINDYGNLVLTLQNPSLSNKEFKNKLPLYLSKLATFAELEIGTDYKDWSFDQISDRKERLKSWALERWGDSAVEKIGISGIVEASFREANEVPFMEDSVVFDE